VSKEDHPAQALRRGLPQTTDAELRALFEQAGEVDSAVVITDSGSGLSKGFGCVEMIL
jgi:RNA recognition motif-containing protein